MSTTRLVVLGAVRIFQPVHGYYVRRELMTWRVDEWANINPGSIYNALRALTREGFLEEVDTGGTGGRPGRTTYQLTADGESELMTLLRAALWNVEAFDPQPIMAILSFMWALPRQEVIEGFEHRIAEIDRRLVETEDDEREVPAAATTSPTFGREMARLTAGRLMAEQEWSRLLVKRLRNGEYVFADERGDGPVGAPQRMI
jgi:DNA-binding PadR family transcriptional regulator